MVRVGGKAMVEDGKNYEVERVKGGTGRRKKVRRERGITEICF